MVKMSQSSLPYQLSRHLVWLSFVLLISLSILLYFALDRHFTEMYDSALAETAQHILPIAVIKLINNSEEALTQHTVPLKEYSEHPTYAVKASSNDILL